MIIHMTEVGSMNLKKIIAIQKGIMNQVMHLPGIKYINIAHSKVNGEMLLFINHQYNQKKFLGLKFLLTMIS